MGAKDLNALQLAAAGGFSGILTTTIMAPGERIKCLLQVQQASTGPPKYSGPVDVAKSLYREGGLRSVFKGSAATAARDAPASAAYFASYELIQRWLQGEDRQKLSIGSTLFAGGWLEYSTGLSQFRWMLSRVGCKQLQRECIKERSTF